MIKHYPSMMRSHKVTIQNFNIADRLKLPKLLEPEAEVESDDHAVQAGRQTDAIEVLIAGFEINAVEVDPVFPETLVNETLVDMADVICNLGAQDAPV